MKKFKILIPSIGLTSILLPVALLSVGCSNQKDSRDQTDDSNVTKVEIPTIEVNKSFDVKVTLKDGYIVDGNNTIITINGQTLSYANNDFKIISQANDVSLIIRVEAQKVTSTNVSVKVVSKAKPSTPSQEIIFKDISLELTHNALTNKYFYSNSDTNKQMLGIRIDGIDLSSTELASWTFSVLEKSSEEGKDYFKQAGFAFDATNNSTLVWKCPVDGFTTIPTSTDSKVITIQAKKGEQTLSVNIPLLMQEPHVCEIRNVPTAKPTIDFRYTGAAYRNLSKTTISNVSMVLYDTVTKESITPTTWSSKVYKKSSQEYVADVEWAVDSTNKTISLASLALGIQTKYWTLNDNEFEVKFIGKYQGSTYVASTNMSFIAKATEAIVTTKDQFLTAINNPNIGYIRLGADIKLNMDECITIDRSLKIDGWDSKHKIYIGDASVTAQFYSMFTITPNDNQEKIDVEFTNINFSLRTSASNSSVIKIDGDFSKLSVQPTIKINNTCIQNYNSSNQLDGYGLLICPSVGQTLNQSLNLKVDVEASRFEGWSAVYNETSNVDFTAKNSIFIGYDWDHKGNCTTIITSDYAIANIGESPTTQTKSFSANNRFNFINCDIQANSSSYGSNTKLYLIENRSLANNRITIDDETIEKSKCPSYINYDWYVTTINDDMLANSDDFFTNYSKNDKPSGINTYAQYKEYYKGDKISCFVGRQHHDHFDTGKLTIDREWDFTTQIVGGSVNLVIDPLNYGFDTKKWSLVKGGEKMKATFHLQMIDQEYPPDWLGINSTEDECNVYWIYREKTQGYSCQFKIQAQPNNSNNKYESEVITLTVDTIYTIEGLPASSTTSLIGYNTKMKENPPGYEYTCGNAEYTTPNEIKLMGAGQEVTEGITTTVSATCGTGKTLTLQYVSKKIVLSPYSIYETGYNDDKQAAEQLAYSNYKKLFDSPTGEYSNPFTVTISMEYKGKTYTGQFQIEFLMPI